MSTIEAVKRAANWTASEPDDQRQCLQCKRMELRIGGKFRPWCLEHGFWSVSRARMRFSSEKEFDVIRDRNIVWKPNQPAHEKLCEGCRNGLACEAGGDVKFCGVGGVTCRDCGPSMFGACTYSGPCDETGRHTQDFHHQDCGR